MTEALLDHASFVGKNNLSSFSITINSLPPLAFRQKNKKLFNIAKILPPQYRNAVNMDPPQVLKRLQKAFHKNFLTQGELGASLCLYQRGELLCEWSQGYTTHKKEHSWTNNTLIPIFSATKGASAAAVLLALYQHGLSPETLVRTIWDKFPLAKATIGQLLSHQCGLAALDYAVDIHDHNAVIEAINHQTPAWAPPQHGYHARMFGPIAEHIIRLLTSIPLGEYWNQAIRIPLNIEFWIGLPTEQFPRVARLYPGKASAEELAAPFYKDYLTEGTLIRRTFTSPRGYLSVQEMNHPKAWQAALPALGGIATARGLAEFYQACLGYSCHKAPLIFPQTVQQWMNAPQSNGMDKILQTQTAFSNGFMLDPINNSEIKTRHLFGPDKHAFGHPGAGGSMGLADPLTGISFAYTMNQMELGILPGRKTQTLLDALFDQER